MRLTVHTKFGNKITIKGMPVADAQAVVNHFKHNSVYSTTLYTSDGRSMTIPLNNIDYIEVR